MDTLQSSLTEPVTSNENRLKNIVEADIAKNTISLTETTLSCSRQCLALRGHRDESTASPFSIQGIFLSWITVL